MEALITYRLQTQFERSITNQFNDPYCPGANLMRQDLIDRLIDRLQDFMTEENVIKLVMIPFHELEMDMFEHGEHNAD